MKQAPKRVQDFAANSERRIVDCPQVRKRNRASLFDSLYLSLSFVDYSMQSISVVEYCMQCKCFLFRSQKDWAVSFGIALAICVLYQVITGSSAFSIGSLFYTAVLTVAAVVVRPKSIEDQYAWSVVLMAFVTLFLSSYKLTSLVLGAVPPVINYTMVTYLH